VKLALKIIPLRQSRYNIFHQSSSIQYLIFIAV